MENLPPTHFTTMPVIEGAPGLSWERRRRGFAARWDASPALCRRGFLPRKVTIWVGTDLTDHTRSFIRSRCVGLQSVMDAWAVANQPKPIPFDGMLHSLIDNYLCDSISKHHENRYASRDHTVTLCRRLLQDHGSAVIAEIKYRTLLEWHKEWLGSGVSMAHSLMGQLGVLFNFGMTILECEHCARVSLIRHTMRFENGKPRKKWMVLEQIAALCEAAHRQGLHSMAIAQAFQFECTFRQKDVIGEMVPVTEPGDSDLIVGNEKWLRGIRWEEIDAGFKLHHVTSKRDKLVEPPLLEGPMVVAELMRAYPGCVTKEIDEKATAAAGETVYKLVPHRELLPASGPIIVSERTGLPYTAMAFRLKWRELARSVGIPDDVKNMDTRASAITEATNAGVSLDIAAKAAAHSNTSQTANYSRDQSEKHGISMRARADDRARRLNDAREGPS